MIKNWLFRRKPRPTFDAIITPEDPLFVIGDIHGRSDLLRRLVEQADPSAQIVCVGDYVDRGEDSAGVMRFLADRPDIICLSGNHEQMMLDFMSDPVRHGPRWLRYGGLQTLASFQVSGIRETSDAKRLNAAKNELVDALGQNLMSWLAALHPYWQSGNVAIVHAGADPQNPITLQTTETFHWGHADFLSVPRSDGTWIVHGHTIVDAPFVQSGRISIDTGAYATSTLTAAKIDKGSVEFIQA